MRHRLLCFLSCLALITGPAAAATTLQVLIDMRGEIAAGRFEPTRDAVGVRGAGAPLSWGRSVAAQRSAEPGLWRATLQFDEVPAAGRALAYKFKIERPGQPDEGWEPGRNRSMLLLPGAQTLARAFGDDPGALPPQRSGRIDRLPPAPSTHVGPREVQVWLPPGYEVDAARRYPVLYLHDGQNVFDAVAAGAEWQVDETALRLVQSGAVAPFIVVAVASTGERIHDYTPVAGPSGQSGPSGPSRREGGGAAAYGRYLVHELKPAIDTRYRTLPGRSDTAVGGSSLGGLVSMWLLLAHGDTFGAGLVVSPSVWWADGAIVAQVAAAPAALPAPRIWLDVGCDEGAGMLDGARRLRAALQQRGWHPSYLEAPGAGHDETAWAARVEPMLRFLHGRPAQ